MEKENIQLLDFCPGKLSHQCEYCLNRTKLQPDYDGRHFCCEDCRIQYRKLKMDTPFIGEHLISPRKGYIHHGLGDEQGGVLHYSGFSERAASGPVIRSSLKDFACGKKVLVLRHKFRKYDLQESVQRGETRLGEQNYDLPSNNCEHFVNWCIEGKVKSRQVDKVATYATGISVFAIAILVLDVFAVTGAAAVGSYLLLPRLPEIKYGSGLLLILTTLGLIGALLLGKLMSLTILRDHSWLSAEEKRSRLRARRAAYIAAFATALSGFIYKWIMAELLLNRGLMEKMSQDSVTHLINISLLIAAALPAIMTLVAGLVVHRILSRNITPVDE